jgi:hypothetical protein
MKIRLYGPRMANVVVRHSRKGILFPAVEGYITLSAISGFALGSRSKIVLARRKLILEGAV